MASELVRKLVDSGVHYGHRASRWNPKMRPFIFGKRNTIHIIDIRETVKGLLRAKKFIARVVAGGGDVLFVGTKRQAKPLIVQHASKVNMPYVVERWLGGTLTNFKTIRSRLGRLDELEKAEADGSALEYSKKMIASRTREASKIKRNLEGIRNMTRQPKALVVIDVQREHIAVREAKKLGIPTICLIDTDSDPDFADIPIPGNDDAMRAIETVLMSLTDAVEEGMRGRTRPRDAGEGPAAPRREPRERPQRQTTVAPTAPSGESPKVETQAPRTDSSAAQPSARIGDGESPPSPDSGPAADDSPDSQSSS